MIVDKIDVSGDPRVEKRTADINGKQYGMQYSCEETGWHEGIAFHAKPDILKTPADETRYQDTCTASRKARFEGRLFLFVTLSCIHIERLGN